jgi:hypothetical protein
MNGPAIHFKTCISAYNCLREMACRIEQSQGSTTDWRILFVDGLRGFAARLTTITKSLGSLDRPFQTPADNLVPEQWAIDTDRLIAEVFFGMDSALECFVFAMNAIGFVKSQADFCDITTDAGLKQIKPENIHCESGDKKNPRPGYLKYFPRIAAYWKSHQSLIAEIMSYHDVSKHRSCIVHSATPGHHALPDQPKQPGSLFRPSIRTVEEIASAFHTFCEGLMVEAVEELSTVFGVSVGRKHRQD